MKKRNYQISHLPEESMVNVTKKINIEDYFKAVKEGKYKNPINKLRFVYNETKCKDSIAEMKKELPKIAPCGTFKDNYRSGKNFLEHSGIIHFDIDHISKGQLNEAREKLEKQAETIGFHISPSGTGLKYFVAVENVNAENHKQVYKLLHKKYEQLTELQFDNVQDLARLCYYSYDPDAYFNTDVTPVYINEDELYQFKSQNLSTSVPIYTNSSHTGIAQVFERSKANYIKENGGSWSIGHRNHILYWFACQASREGYSMSDIQGYALTKVEQGLPLREIVQTCESAWSSSIEQHGKYASKSEIPPCPPVQVSTCPQEEEEVALDTVKEDSPFIKREVYENLPKQLKYSCEYFKEGRERDVFLISTLCTISGGMSFMKMNHGGDWVYPNLWCLISAPPSSGKGVLKHSRILGNYFELPEPEQDFSIDLEGFTDVTTTEGQEQKPRFYIPANMSERYLLKQLELNNGVGCIHTTELGQMLSALGQDWGNFSSGLCQAFHHEPLEQGRVQKGASQIIVEKPKMSIAASGVPRDAEELFKHRASGLSSRFLYYSWEQPFQYVSQRSKGFNFEDTLKPVAEEIASILNDRKNAECVLTHKQEDKIDELGHQWAEKYGHFEWASEAIPRPLLYIKKIAMVFTALASNQDNTKLWVTDAHFEAAMSLVRDTFFPHTLKLFNQKPDIAKSNYINILWSDLPDEFSRNELIEVAISEGYMLNEKTLRRHRDKAVEAGILEKVNHNKWRKIQ